MIATAARKGLLLLSICCLADLAYCVKSVPKTSAGAGQSSALQHVAALQADRTRAEDLVRRVVETLPRTSPVYVRLQDGYEAARELQDAYLSSLQRIMRGSDPTEADVANAVEAARSMQDFITETSEALQLAPVTGPAEARRVHLFMLLRSSGVGQGRKRAIMIVQDSLRELRWQPWSSIR